MQYRKQLRHPNCGYEFSCDLLEKSYFCSIANNEILEQNYSKLVVICLKNRTFAVSQTTGEVTTEQRFSCDLLEKSYFCSIANNLNNPITGVLDVVICLKNRTFAVSQTTYDNSQHIFYCCDLLEKSYFCSIANNHLPLTSS